MVGRTRLTINTEHEVGESPLPIKKDGFLSIKRVDGEHRETVKAVSVY